MVARALAVLGLFLCGGASTLRAQIADSVVQAIERSYRAVQPFDAPYVSEFGSYQLFAYDFPAQHPLLKSLTIVYKKTYVKDSLEVIDRNALTLTLLAERTEFEPIVFAVSLEREDSSGRHTIERLWVDDQFLLKGNPSGILREWMLADSLTFHALAADFVRRAAVKRVDLNFDPFEELGISRDSMNLLALEYVLCKKIELFPKGGIKRFLSGITVKVQECFLDEGHQGKLIITSYEDKERGRTPIALAYARARVDSTKGAPRIVYDGVWGKGDEGFAKEGEVSRTWITVEPKPKKTVEQQLIDILLPGYRKAKANGKI